jgi:DNA-binding beta-propeller fold protein YncE
MNRTEERLPGRRGVAAQYIEVEAKQEARRTGPRVGAIALIITTTVAILVLGTTSALAAVEHKYESSITEAELLEPFLQPWGLSLDSFGNLYVADASAKAIDIFNPSRLFTGRIGDDHPAGFVFPEEFTRSVAVSNASKDVYVAESGPEDVFAFKPAGGGEYEELQAKALAGGFMYVAVDNSSGPRGGDVYVMSSKPEVHVVVIKPNAEGRLEEEGRQLEPPLGGFSLADRPLVTSREQGGLAVNPSDGKVYIANPEHQEVDVYADTGTKEQSSFEGTETPAGFFEPIAVAVDPQTGEVYVVDGANHVVDEFTGAGTYEGQIIAAEPTVGGLEPLVEPLGVVVGSAGQVYISDAGTKAIDIYGAQEQLPPSVEGESVTLVTDDSATLNAEINPRSRPGAHETEYHFEYGVCPSPTTCRSVGYDETTPPMSLGASFEAEPVFVHVTGLAAGFTYHFRVVAENSITQADESPVEGVEQTFTTRSSGAFVLPDARQWEMVSPPEKNGALIVPSSIPSPLQAAADGGAITYTTSSPTESEPAGYSNAVQVLSTRATAGVPSWESRDIAIPHHTATGISSGLGSEYRFFSEDLSHAVVQPFGAFEPALSTQASEQTPYLRTNYSDSAPRTPCEGSCYFPLVTGIEGYADVLPGTHFSTAGECPKEGGSGVVQVFCGPHFVGATGDLSHVVLSSTLALTHEASSEGLYEWSAGKSATDELQPVSILPDNEPASRPELGIDGVEARHAISNGGSRVVFTAEGQLYVRDTVKHRTLRVDVPEPACASCGGGAVDPEFQAASSDGSRVFFTDTQQLKPDGGSYETRHLSTERHGADLYECRIVEIGEALQCDLTDLAPKGSVLGSLPAVSNDGSWIYFVANSVLAEGAIHGTCNNRDTQIGSRETCNLYLYHEGETKLVAVLSGDDSPDWSLALSGQTAQVSPNGEWFAFMSARPLTGYDNRDALSGRPDEEVFLYNARNGGLSCASCNPAGARPHGIETGSVTANPPLTLGEQVWQPASWLAANVLAWTPYQPGKALYQPRYLSDEGRLIFDASDAIVPKDVNSAEDVYEYEPEGVGSKDAPCGPASVSGSEVLKPSRNVEVEGRTIQEGQGCVGLISSGRSLEEAGFLDASENGSDVFFLTTSKLAPQDFDDALDIYDAQECTASSPCLTPAAPALPPCDTEASCKAAPSPQPTLFGASGSATFSGPGNPPPAVVKPKTAAQIRAEKLTKALRFCRKDRSKRKRVVCVKQARRKYGPITARNVVKHRAGK